MIEVPLEKERNFMLLNASIMVQAQEHDDIGGHKVLLRAMYENCKGKKFRELFVERLMLRTIHSNPGIKPHYIPIGADVLERSAMKSRKVYVGVISHVDHEEEAREEQ